MFNLRKTIWACSLLAIVAAPGTALAHDVWLTTEKQGTEWVAHVLFGDPSHLELADYHKIVSLDLMTASGTVNLKRPLLQTLPGAKPALETKPFALPQGAILAVTLDNGFYAVDPRDGIEANTNKLFYPEAKESWWVPKFGKTLLGPGSWQVMTHSLLEIVPLSDPFAGGSKLSVRLEHKGQPVAGAKLTYTDGIAPIDEDSRPTVTTDKNGVAEIDLKRKGPYLITADYLAPPTWPELAAKDELYATLAFDLTK